MIINIIVSVSENWTIGKDNKLLWKLSNDLIRFKELTTEKAVIMGQKTFESLPKGALPNRFNIVLTDSKDFNAPNIKIAYDIPSALKLAENEYGSDSDVFIIGGGSIYRQFLDLADYIYLTVVHTKIDGDTTFPEIDSKKWKLISSELKRKDSKNEYDHTYKLYKKYEN